MAVQYTVNAAVVDLRNDQPRPTDRFFVDTNVWYWMIYPSTTRGVYPPRRYQVSNYPRYLSAGLQNGASFFYAGLSLGELAHLIERTEFGAFVATNPTPSVTAKQYRHNYPSERANVTTEIDTAWSQVEGLAQSADLLINQQTTASAIQACHTMALDGYDLLMREAMQAAGLSQVITDDGDFCTVPGVTVFTSNNQVIQAAQAAGRLAVR